MAANKTLITLAGIGPGSFETMTVAVAKAIAEADVIFGAKRLVESLSGAMAKELAGFLPHSDGAAASVEKLPIYKTAEILAHLKAHPEYKHPLVLFSGDTGFYSGALSFVRDLNNSGEDQNYDTRFLCGISSIVYFCSKAQKSWHDVTLLSRHGRECNVVGHLRHAKKCLLLLSGLSELKEIGTLLENAEREEILEKVSVTFGYQLTLPEEEIRTVTPAEMQQLTKEGLYVLYIEHSGSHLDAVVPGLPDSAFLRGKAPMTKEEVRAVSLCKLRLKKDSVVYDIGAGTGSVSVEAALICIDGAVHAVEYKDDAYELLLQNRDRFCLENLNVIHGKAPEAMAELPAPTHAFIGGSAGNMEQILNCLLEKNPKIRIVLNCIALETLSEVTNILKKLPVTEPEFVLLQASRADQVGSYHLMKAENPIYIISFEGKG